MISMHSILGVLNLSCFVSFGELVDDMRLIDSALPCKLKNFEI